MKPLITALCVALGLMACAAKSPRTTMLPNNHPAFTSMELGDGFDDTVLTEPAALKEALAILENSPVVAKRSDQIDFVEMQKLRLVHPDPKESKIYIIDLQSGHARILSKTMVPVYKLSDPKRFKAIIETSGKPK